MKSFFLITVLLALIGCSKDNSDGAKTRCCTDANWKTVSPHPSLVIMPPNVITPNGDGLNERFQVVAFDMSSSAPNSQVTFAVQALKVFRPGLAASVFSSTNYQNEFDGHNNKGAELPEGTYRYELTLDDNTVAGNICIVRSQKPCDCRAVDLHDPLLPDCP